MNRPHTRLLPFPHLLLALVVLSPYVTQADDMCAESLLRFEWEADPRISPDGSRVAFVRVSIDAEEDAYRSRLWIVDTETGQSRQITSGQRDNHPRWSPDGCWIAFLRDFEPNSPRSPLNGGKTRQKRPQVFLLPTDAGEARQLTHLKHGVDSFVWAPDSTTIALLTTKPPPPNGEDLADLLPAAKTKAIVVTRPTFRRDGEPGIVDPDERSHIWSVNIDSRTPKPLTSGSYDDRDPVFSADGKTLYFTSDRRAEPWFGPRDSNVYAIPATGGDPRVAFDINGPLESPAVSPHGETLAALGYVEPSKTRSYNQTDLLISMPGAIVNVTESFDLPLGNAIGADARPPIANGSERLRFMPDGWTVVTQVSRRGQCGLVEIDTTTGRYTDLVAGDREVISWSMTPDGRRFALLIASPIRTGDIHILERGHELRRLTNIQDKSLSDLTLTEPEEFWITSFDGRRINGWILKPPDFDPTRKYPMILQIHGGPHMAYGYGFYQEFHLLAARGYVVVYVNPRGSTTYGQEFGNVIQYKYPGDDYRDLMAAVDHVLARGYVDENRLGVTGGSGGGLLTNWIVTQTDRFAAAVTQRCVSDWASFYYTADFTLYTPFWFRTAPFEDPSEYARRSPITYVDRISTPLLIVHSENDYRTPIAQGEALFRALVALRKPVAMVRFPASSHGLSRNGKPSLRIERMNHIVNWFDMFLKGRVTGDYGDRLRDIAKQRQPAAATTIP